MQPHERRDDLDLAALQVADEVPRERVAVRGDLRLQVLRAVLADRRDPGLREQPEILERDVLAGGDELDVRGVAPGARGGRRDPLAHLGEVRADELGGEAGDQLGHGSRQTTAAWRPVASPSRRCEKKRPGGAQSVQSPTS